MCREKVKRLSPFVGEPWLTFTIFQNRRHYSWFTKRFLYFIGVVENHFLKAWVKEDCSWKPSKSAVSAIVWFINSLSTRAFRSSFNICWKLVPLSLSFLCRVLELIKSALAMRCWSQFLSVGLALKRAIALCFISSCLLFVSWETALLFWSRTKKSVHPLSSSASAAQANAEV